MIKRFKNNNINIRFDASDVMDINADHVSAMEVLCWALDEVDCTLYNEYCFSNYEMAYDFYCYYNEKVYTILDSEVEKLKRGYTIKLEPQELDGWSIELLIDGDYINGYSLEFTENNILLPGSAIYFANESDLIKYCELIPLEVGQKWYVTCKSDDTWYYDSVLTERVNKEVENNV